jgi:sugar (pentulose or hexulose) kinase
MRATAEIEELTQRYGRQCGAWRHTTHDPGCRAKGVVVATSLRCGRGLPSWYNSNSFIVERLTGEYILDHHTANLLPYFAGERTPIFDPRARGVIAGLILHHHPQPRTRDTYETLYRGYCDLYPATKTFVRRLAQVQEEQAVAR